VIATFRKPIKSPSYTELCYTAKGIDLSKVSLPEHIKVMEAEEKTEKRPPVLARLREPLPKKERSLDRKEKSRYKDDPSR